MIKKLTHSVLAGAVVGTLTFCSSALADSPNYVEFVLDASGSMEKQLNGKTQMQIAKDALLNALSDITAGSSAALRVYAHRVPQNQKEDSCKDSELLLNFATPDQGEFAAKLSSIKPLGFTPIAYSLEQVVNDFPAGIEAKKTVILLSDGEETCAGDPVDVVKRLRASGFDVTVHVIGFNVDSKTGAQLRQIAIAGNGQYFDAANERGLRDALTEATKKAVLIDKQQPTIYGDEIRGGDSVESAVVVETNKEYRLDHHQKRNEWDYFYLDLKPGQVVEAQIRTREKGVSIGADGRIAENEHPYAGLRILGPEQESVKDLNIIGGKNIKEVFELTPETPGRYYFLIGSGYEALNKDQASFQFNIIARGDADGDSDAGNDLQAAIKIQPQRYQKNYIGGADKVDLFSFDAKRGERFFVGLVPGGEEETWWDGEVFDEYKQPLVTAKSKAAGAGFKSDEFEVASDGTYYLKISQPNTAKAISYALDLRKIQ